MHHDYIFGYVVDADGFCTKRGVIILVEPDEYGRLTKQLIHDKLEPGEILVDVAPPPGVPNPRWDGSQWVEKT